MERLGNEGFNAHDSLIYKVWVIGFKSITGKEVAMASFHHPWDAINWAIEKSDDVYRVTVRCTLDETIIYDSAWY
jgi:hypothetical protein